MEDPAHYGTIPETNSCHATAIPDPIGCKWKILHTMGPFQKLIPVMLQLCQIKATPKNKHDMGPFQNLSPVMLQLCQIKATPQK